MSRYIKDYHDILEKRKDRSMDEAAIIQNASYNYTLHDRDRKKAEKERDETRRRLMVVSIIALCCFIVILIFLLIKEKVRSRLYKTLIKIRLVKDIQSDAEIHEHQPEDSKEAQSEVVFGGDSEASDAGEPDPIEEVESSCKAEMEMAPLERMEEEAVIEDSDISENLNEARIQLRKSLLELYEKNRSKPEKMELPESLVESPTYAELKRYVVEQHNIEMEEELWTRIKEMMDGCFPDFYRRLRLLTDGRLTVREEQTAVLVKCGLRKVEIEHLLGRSKGAIGSRRTSIAMKIFGENMELRKVDGFIQLL